MDLHLTNLSNEELWTQWAIAGQEPAFYELVARFKQRILPYAIKMLRGSFVWAQTLEHAHDFYAWCLAAPEFRRRLFTFNPEKGFKLSTYLGHILRSCWSIYFRKHLSETLLKKHGQSDGVNTDSDDDAPSLLARMPDESMRPDEAVFLQKAIKELIAVVPKLSGSDAYIVESLHFEALGGRFSETAREFIQTKLNSKPDVQAKKIAQFHAAGDIHGLREFLAKGLKVSMSSLHVRVHRAQRRLRDLIEEGN